MSVEYEPSSEPLHISAKYLFLNRESRAQLSGEERRASSGLLRRIPNRIPNYESRASNPGSRIPNPIPHTQLSGDPNPESQTGNPNPESLNFWQVSGEERRAPSGLLRRASSGGSGGSRRRASGGINFGDEEAGSGIAGMGEDPELRAEVRTSH